jgi:hypothetical protein
VSYICASLARKASHGFADTWVHRITPARHVFIVSYGTRYTGDEHPTYSHEHNELGLFAYQEIAGLHMPEPYKITINRWRRLGQG